ncbi:hypothetical protein [Nitrosococcus oceani]|uniref:hypothetical protein n=1 Tax=Nitrosococcus oceani TaxID=1229 RepID=UPI0012E04143|nr:hypothetical protein [Nitrosococcus oceani]
MIPNRGPCALSRGQPKAPIEARILQTDKVRWDRTAVSHGETPNPTWREARAELNELPLAAEAWNDCSR